LRGFAFLYRTPSSKTLFPLFSVPNILAFGHTSRAKHAGHCCPKSSGTQPASGSFFRPYSLPPLPPPFTLCAPSRIHYLTPSPVPFSHTCHLVFPLDELPPPLFPPFSLLVLLASQSGILALAVHPPPSRTLHIAGCPLKGCSIHPHFRPNCDLLPSTPPYFVFF